MIVETIVFRAGMTEMVVVDGTVVHPRHVEIHGDGVRMRSVQAVEVADVGDARRVALRIRPWEKSEEVPEPTRIDVIVLDPATGSELRRVSAERLAVNQIRGASPPNAPLEYTVNYLGVPA